MKQVQKTLLKGAFHVTRASTKKNTPFSRPDLGQTLAEDTVFPEEENPHQNSAEETGQRSEKGRGTDPRQTFYVSSPWNMI